jgi:hypothetical protein
MPTSKETGHGDVEDVTVFGKKPRDSGRGRLKKIGFTWDFRILQLTKNY